MRELTAQLSASGIEYRQDADGMVRYRNRDAERVKRILRGVDTVLNTGEEMKWENEEHRRHFIEVLEASKKKYRLEPRDDGIWIRWYPENQAEARELPARALERVIAARKVDSRPCEPPKAAADRKAPSNLSLSKDAATTRGAC